MNPLLRLDRQPELGSLRIHHQVLSQIAAQAALRTPGVVRVGRPTARGWRQWLGLQPSRRPIHIRTEGQNVKLNLMVIAGHGVHIPSVISQAQETVKEAIEEMTGLNVVEVNVDVEGIDTGPLLTRTVPGTETGRSVVL